MVATATSNERSRTRWLWLVVPAIGALTFLAHVRGVTGQFLYWDDDSHITRNPYIRELTGANVAAMFSRPIAKLYVPLTWLSLAIDHAVYGRDPLGYHLTNTLFHVLNTLVVMALVFAVAEAMTVGAAARSWRVAVLAATIFGVHPLHVESVAWATERKDVLFTLFYLAGLLAYTTRQRRGGHGAGWYWLSFGLFVAAVLSKATAVTFPLGLLLLDGLVFHRLDCPVGRRPVWLEKLPFLAVSLGAGLITVMAQARGAGETVASVAAIPISARVGLVGFCSLFYLWKFCWPLHLSAIYPTFDEMAWSTGWGVVLVVVLAGLGTLLWRLRRRWPVLALGFGFYLCALFPTIGLLPVGIHVVADRYAYLAILGLAVLAAAGLVWWGERQRAGEVAALVLVIVLVGLTMARTTVWHDTGTLFRSVLRDDPRCLPALINLTKWHSDHAEFELAIAYGQRAIEVAPGSVPARRNLGAALFKAGRREAAEQVLRPIADHPDIAPLWAIVTTPS